jgi:hypothetical protein
VGRAQPREHPVFGERGRGPERPSAQWGVLGHEIAWAVVSLCADPAVLAISSAAGWPRRSTQGPSTSSWKRAHCPATPAGRHKSASAWKGGARRAALVTRVAAQPQCADSVKYFIEEKSVSQLTTLTGRVISNP